MQAAILRVKLHHVDAWNQQRRAIADIYTKRLSLMDIVTPSEAPNTRHVYHLYTVCFVDRDRVQSKLKNAGIASDIYYPCPPHLADPCRPFGYQPGDFPVAEDASREVLSIPLYPEMSEEQVNFIIETVQQILEKENTCRQLTPSNACSTFYYGG